MYLFFEARRSKKYSDRLPWPVWRSARNTAVLVCWTYCSAVRTAVLALLFCLTQLATCRRYAEFASEICTTWFTNTLSICLLFVLVKCSVVSLIVHTTDWTIIWNWKISWKAMKRRRLQMSRISFENMNDTEWVSNTFPLFFVIFNRHIAHLPFVTGMITSSA